MSYICKIPDTRSLNEANDANIEFKDRSIIFCGKMRQQYFQTQKEKDNGRTGKFLIVDDNPEIREVAMVLLQGEGFTVDEAGDGKEALDKIEHGAYDLILLDVMIVIGCIYFRFQQVIGCIRKPLEELKKSSVELAAGKVDVELKKYYNDEIGEVLDVYAKIIKNTKENAMLAQKLPTGI